MHYTPSILVESLILREMGTYNDQYLRPLVVDADNDHLSHLTETIIRDYAQGSNTPVSAESMSTVAGILHPSYMPAAKAMIANGWGTKRLSFILRIAVTNHHQHLQSAGKQVYFIQGFSEYYDPTYTGNIDPDMNLYINNIVLANETMGVNGVSHTVVSSTNVLFNPEYHTGNDGTDYHVARPQDVFTAMNTLELTNNGEVVSDYRSKLVGGPKSMSKSMSSSAVYLSEIINNWEAATELAEIGNDVNDVYSAATANVASGDLSRNPFIRAIANISGYEQQASFTLNNLKAIDPDLEHKSRIVSDSAGATAAHLVGATEDWSIPTDEAQLSTQIGGIMSGLCMDTMATSINFFATNGENNRDEVSIISVNFMVRSQYSNQQGSLVARIVRDIIPLLSMNSQRLYCITVMADALGETYIDISLNGGPMVRYCVPTFADSAISNVLVPTHGHLLNVADGLSTVLETARSAIADVNSYGQTYAARNTYM